MDELITLTEANEACRLCNLKKIDDFRLGPLFLRDGFVAHYYCVLFSGKVPQRGEDGEGILGFLVKDLKIEVNRVKKIICAYCKKPNASIYCGSRGCKIKFHFPCGIAQGSLHQFQGQFKSYCNKHRPVQEIPEHLINKAEEEETPCAICYDSVDHRNTADTIWANCCSTTWYHRDCLQKHALSSGYFFKCAICNDNETFKNWVQKYGIFVPQKDASWELEPNAFGDLTRQYSQCDARDCKCPDGRECDLVDTMWEIVLCRTCGSQGMHIMCGHLKFYKPLWQCELCKNVITKFLSERKRWNVDMIREGLKGQGAAKAHSNRHEDENGPTSSGRERISLEPPGRGNKSKQVTKKLRKRKRAEAEDGEKPIKKKYKRRGPVGSRAVRKHATEEGKATELNRDMGALHIKDVDNQNNNNEAGGVEEDPARKSISAEEDSDDEFTPEEIERRKKIEEDGLQMVHLKTSQSSTDEEVDKVFEAYWNHQRTDLKYCVKKDEIATLSDDESNDSEVEVILDEEDSQGKTRESRHTSDVNITVCMALKAPITENGSGGKSMEKNATAKRGVVFGDAKEMQEAEEPRDGQDVTILLQKRLDNSCVSADMVDTLDGMLSNAHSVESREIRRRTFDLETLKRFQRHIERLIEAELKKKKVKTKKSNSGDMRRKSTDEREKSTECDMSGVDDNDIEVVEIVRPKRKRQLLPANCTGQYLNRPR